jgi:hypothetical protein
LKAGSGQALFWFCHDTLQDICIQYTFVGRLFFPTLGEAENKKGNLKNVKLMPLFLKFNLTLSPWGDLIIYTLKIRISKIEKIK